MSSSVDIGSRRQAWHSPHWRQLKAQYHCTNQRFTPAYDLLWGILKQVCRKLILCCPHWQILDSKKHRDLA